MVSYTKPTVFGTGKIRLMYSEQRMFIIEWTVNGKKSFNTYLAGTPKYDFEQYKSWLEKINKL